MRHHMHHMSAKPAYLLCVTVMHMRALKSQPHAVIALFVHTYVSIFYQMPKIVCSSVNSWRGSDVQPTDLGACTVTCRRICMRVKSIQSCTFGTHNIVRAYLICHLVWIKNVVSQIADLTSVFASQLTLCEKLC